MSGYKANPEELGLSLYWIKVAEWRVLWQVLVNTVVTIGVQ